jgi:hypothetical protein
MARPNQLRTGLMAIVSALPLLLLERHLLYIIA